VRRYYGVVNNGPDALLTNLAFVSDELNGITAAGGVVRPKHMRDFQGGLWKMIEENGRSRVFLGVHWIFDAFAVDPTGAMDLNQKVGGVRLGIDIANDIATNGLDATAAAGPRLP
jgi:vanadium chloroperoxidase